jgi:hypothetical protein
VGRQVRNHKILELAESWSGAAGSAHDSVGLSGMAVDIYVVLHTKIVKKVKNSSQDPSIRDLPSLVLLRPALFSSTIHFSFRGT